MKLPEQYRTPHPLGWPHKEGDGFGWFTFQIGGRSFLAQADDGTETQWEHVSVSTRGRCPTWDEMCYVKNLFWSEEETVVQYHPPKSEYVNMAKTCLHLWRYKGEMPMPGKWMVGI